MSRVLIVDDEESIRLVLKTLLKKNGYESDTAASAEEALEKCVHSAPDFILTDVRMGGMDGIAFVRALRERQIESVVIVMSAYGSVDLAIEAMRAGAYDYVAKPFKQDEVLLALRKAEEREELKRENKALREVVQSHTRFEEMLGDSDPMRRVFRVIEKAANFATTVLILGESGTGKELVARALHRHGTRKDKPFVAVNCGAIPEALLESELFGHKRGAFTDASSDKAGLFEEADGGTLFLDEIGEMPLALQVKLLRVLQESVLRRLGDTRDRKIDVRVVAATARDLDAAVEEGTFREDLFYRLNVLPIQVPPLRERKADIPLLVEHFVQKHNKRLHTGVERVDARRDEGDPRVPVARQCARAGEPDGACDGARGWGHARCGRLARPSAQAGGHRGACARLRDLSIKRATASSKRRSFVVRSSRHRATAPMRHVCLR